MDTRQLGRLCRMDPHINPVFQGVFPSDCLPKKQVYPSAYIANTDGKAKPGAHWVAVFIDHEGNGDYFDSYGRVPTTIFKTYLDKQCLQWQYNGKQLQTSLTSTCGQYCIFFLHQRCRGNAMNQIINLFGSDTVKNDHMVTKFINEKYQANTKMIDIPYVVDQISKII